MLAFAELAGGNIGYILTLGVRKQYRRQGIASLLLNQYIEHLRLDYTVKCSPESSRRRARGSSHRKMSNSYLNGDSTTGVAKQSGSSINKIQFNDLCNDSLGNKLVNNTNTPFNNFAQSESEDVSIDLELLTPLNERSFLVPSSNQTTLEYSSHEPGNNISRGNYCNEKESRSNSCVIDISLADMESTVDNQSNEHSDEVSLLLPRETEKSVNASPLGSCYIVEVRKYFFVSV